MAKVEQEATIKSEESRRKVSFNFILTVSTQGVAGSNEQNALSLNKRLLNIKVTRGKNESTMRRRMSIYIVILIVMLIVQSGVPVFDSRECDSFMENP